MQWSYKPKSVSSTLTTPTIKEPSKLREHNTLYNANIKVFAKRDDKTCSNQKGGKCTFLGRYA